MLDAAQPLTAVDVEAFGHIKHSAQEAFENAVSNYSIPGLSGEFHPTVPGPPDWPSPTGATAWTSRSFEQSTTVTVAAPDAPKPPLPPRPLPVWAWRVAPPELTVAFRSTQAVVATVPPRPVRTSCTGASRASSIIPSVSHERDRNTHRCRYHGQGASG